MCYLNLSQQLQYCFWHSLHFCNCAHANAHIFHTGTKQINVIINNQEAVVVLLWQLYEFDFTILLIMFLQVYLEWFGVATMNRSFHIICPLIQKR